MIFDVSPSQIQKLDKKEFVELLRKLLHAEARKTGISLRGVSVPLQITVSDDGEDARVSWEKGRKQTNYLPCRFCIFQSKATDPEPAGWKKEMWTAATRKKGITRALNGAIVKAISEGGAYIGFTTATLIGTKKYDGRIEGIREGIKEAGADPDDLAAIDIYDANKIAQWASVHPSVAAWLNERQSGLQLGGFQTIEGWGNNADVASVEYEEDNRRRYLEGEVEQQSLAQDGLTFHQVKERIFDHLAESRNSVRLIGPSAIGKTRFAYELLKDESSAARVSHGVSAIYCDFRNIGQTLFQVASALAELGSPTLLIVDECQRETAIQLATIANASGSELRLITIYFDDRPIELDTCLNIKVSRCDDQLVEAIIRQRLPTAGASEVSYIRNICGGFPGIAVLAANSYGEGAPVLKSIDDVVDRILVGCELIERDQVRAIECLALFERLGADHEFSDQFDFVAEQLLGMSGDTMFEHIARASQHTLVDRGSRYFVVQPLPIATVLGKRRLYTLRVKSLLRFIHAAPEDLLLVMFKRWRYFDEVPAAIEVTRKLLAPDGKFGSLEALNTEFGSECFAALTHVAPDVAAEALDRVFGGLSVDKLLSVTKGRRYLMWTLEKLVFRKQSFPITAPILMRFAAAEIEGGIGNNATGQFEQLFGLYLSGTEAPPQDRFDVLDQGLTSGDDRIVSVCIEALGNTLKQGHFSRSGGAEEIGTKSPLEDWAPKLWQEVFDFHREGLRRLNDIRNRKDRHQHRCEALIASNLRGLVRPNLFEDVEALITTISGEKGIWLEALETVGDWLYFDRRSAPEEFSKKVRGLYDKLLPTDLIQKALLYTKFWSGDIRDPDLDYDREDSSSRDYEYSTRMARHVAAEIAADRYLTEQAIQTMISEDLHNSFPFSVELAQRVSDPVETFKFAIRAYEDTKSRNGEQFIRGMLNGIDIKDSTVGSQCLEIAQASTAFSGKLAGIYTSVDITPNRLAEIVSSLQNGELSASDCISLSYGKGLDDLSWGETRPLLDELAAQHGSAGVWAVLEIVSMISHGGKALDAETSKFIKHQLTSPVLLEGSTRASRDGYLFESRVESISKSDGLDEDFALGLCEQIVRICQVKDHAIFFELDDPIRNVIKLLVAQQPDVIWRELARFYEIAKPLERNWLERLVGPTRHGFDGTSHNSGGQLFGIPEDVMMDWAEKNPQNRVAFLCVFYPILTTDKDGTPIWDTALNKLARKFGQVREFRSALEGRLRPTSWSGSLVPYLEIYLEPLEEWFDHPVPSLAIWARRMYQMLENQIEAEKARDAEDPY